MTDDDLLLVHDYPNLEILALEHDRCKVFYNCCGRISKAKKTTIKTHIRKGLTQCRECAKGNVLPADRQTSYPDHVGQPEALLKGVILPGIAGPHWWASLSK